MHRATPGQRFGSYELITLVGAGGMGEVWRAFDSGLRRHVAVKILPAEFSRDPDRLRRFEQEAQAAGRLNHPNVLTAYAVGREGGAPYLVTELLEGTTLRQKLAAGALSESKAIEYATQLVSGLAAAHEHGIIHRDLKPENVFITLDDRVKILDFGLAKLVTTDSVGEGLTRTASGIVLGTPAYMSPEQVRGEPADHRSDIFAVGVLLYEMLAGSQPFSGETSIEAMHAILKNEPPPISGISTEIEQVVRHCLEKPPATRYQSARDLAFQLQLVRTAAQPAPPMIGRRAIMIGATLVLLAVTAAVMLWFMRSPAPVTAVNLRPLTFDAGLTTAPALSSDGQLVAYASDRAGTGNLDIWRQQLSTGQAVQLTSDPADESEPAFSPDGSWVAYRSERDGGGIWIVSAFGGEARLIAKQGRRPRFSPDGREIAYWTHAGPWYIGKLFIAPTPGGPPTPIASEFASAMYPVWSPDGRHLLFVGARDPKDIPVFEIDWWVVPRTGGPAVKTGAAAIYRREGLGVPNQLISAVLAAAGWIDDHVYFSATAATRANLWRLFLPRDTFQARGVAERLTSGTAIEAAPSITTNGRIAFASLKQDLNIWSLPVVTNVGKRNGDLQQVTGAASDTHTSVSADGKKLVFVSTRSGNPEVWLKDLATGRERPLTSTPLREEQSEISADGTRVTYVVWEDATKAPLYELAIAGGIPERICDECFRPWDWSPDFTKLLFMIPEGHGQRGLAIGLFDRASRQTRRYLHDPDDTLARARFSPDGRWIAFAAVGPDGTHRISIIPFLDQGVPKDHWRTIAEGPFPLNKPRWSPDGNLLYYLSEADGYRCIYARRLNPRTRHPDGAQFDVYHSHNARRSLMNAWFGSLELSLTADKLFFNMGETTGNIWIAEVKP